MRIPLLALAFVVAAAPAIAADPPPGGSADALLARSRAALGGDALLTIRGVHVRSNIVAVGIKGTGEQWMDLAGNRYAEFQDAGPVSGGDGFDGRDYWVQDASGNVHIEGAIGARLQAADVAYFNGYALYRPDHGGATVTAEPQATSGGNTYDVLQVTPPGGSPMRVWFDAKTALPYRAIVALGPATYTVTLDDYRRVAGVLMPYHVHGESEAGNAQDSRTVAVEVNPGGIDAQVQRPASSMRDFLMQGGVTSTTIPFQLVDNHVYLDVRLNGKGPFRFIFDSGGANIVDPTVLAQLGGSSQGNAQGTGVGSQTESSAFTRLSTLDVGNARLTNQYFLVAPVHAGFGVAGGAPADGLIGYEVLARYLTTFDYGHRRVVLRLPGNVTNGFGAAVPIVFHNNTPQVAGRINGVRADMTVDTGSRSAISILKPFADAHPRVVPATLTAPGVNGFGVGGAAIGRLGRVATVHIGPYTVRNVIGDFSQQTKGAFADPYEAANVGGAVWRRFAVTFDYQRYTMYLAPNASFPQPETFDRSGLFLINRGGKPTVLDVRAGTPGARAGLAKGDAIDSIDGRSTSGMLLMNVRNAFMRASGTRVRLTVTRGSEQRTVTLTLRDYV